MQQVIEFIGNHALLAGGFFAAAALLLGTEIARRAQGFRLLSPAQAVAYLNQGGVGVIDVSPAVDFAKGHIKGARNLPLSQIKGTDREVAKLLDKPLLVTCKNGQASGQAAAALVKRGAREVASLKGGMSAWVAEHYPVSRK